MMKSAVLLFTMLSSSLIEAKVCLHDDTGVAVDCFDTTRLCRTMAYLCTDPVHMHIMHKKCARTCGKCESIDTTNSTDSDTKEVYRNGTKLSKCVFPNEKRLTTTVAPSTVEESTETTTPTPITEDTRDRQNLETTSDTQTKSPRTKNMPTRISTSVPSRNATKLPLKMNRLVSNVSSGERNFEARKIKLQELMNVEDNLPVVTTAEPNEFSVSLSKTLIKGTCFDEYIYCREFISLCIHPAFGDVMARHCTLTCNRCDELETEEKGTDDCNDISPECSNYSQNLCGNENYKRLMEQFCPRKCGVCVPKCRDRHPNCAQFAIDGFCQDSMYTSEERKHLCGETCELC